ncbi:MAG: MFS transporter, partial [Chloroflexi bacterium]|nr:MFS transporter [Chloroflexota bacterium]
MKLDNNRMIVRCCNLGMFIQAMVINLTPLLFIPLKDELGLSYEQVGRLVLVNFVTQMVIDLVMVALVDRVNPKPLIVAANLLSSAGLWVFALASRGVSNPYQGLLVGTVVFSVGCGLLEVLLSPIRNAVPSERKAADMTLLHAFYPIGKVVVVVLTALALNYFGARHWRSIMIAWSVIPLLNTLGFSFVHLPPFAPEGQRQTLRSLMRRPAYLLLLLAILASGAAEVTLAQWTSAFAEKGLGVSKLTADLVGFSLFGVGMIIGRLWF